MSDCKCTFAHRMVGDGCDVCNPALALEHALEKIADLEKDAARYRHLRANFASVGMGGVELIWDQPDPQDALDELVDFAMRAEQFPGVDIDAVHRKA